MHLVKKTSTIEDCIQSCRDCHAICVETADFCARLGGEHAEAPHVALLLDCAEICSTSLNSMLRSSATSRQLCGACADICDRCASSCERFVGDEQMQACANACRSCANACRRMVGAASHPVRRES